MLIKKNLKLFLVLFIIAATLLVAWVSLFVTGYLEKEDPLETDQEKKNMSIINLPEPKKDSRTSLERAIENRRSIRSYSGEALGLEDLSQLLWSAQGITDVREGLRAAPSAGALYPLEVYAVVSNDQELAAGVYKYSVDEHSLKRVREGDFSQKLAEAALNQMFVNEAPVNLVIGGDYSVTADRYGDRAEQYVHIEVGHASQNVLLQATSLNLGAVPIGAFDEGRLSEILHLPENKTPLYVIPIGKIE